MNEQIKVLSDGQLAMIESASVRLRLKKSARTVESCQSEDLVAKGAVVSQIVADRRTANMKACRKARLKSSLAEKYEKLSQSSRSSWKKKKYRAKVAKYRRQAETLLQSNGSASSVSFIQFG